MSERSVLNKDLVVFLKKARFLESALMVSFFVIGLLYLSTEVLFSGWKSIPLVALDCYLLVQAIYFLNSYYGAESDKLNPRFEDKKIDGRSAAVLFLALSVLFLVASIAINLVLGWQGWLLIIINYFLWAAYAHPKVNLKGHYLFGTATHFVSAIINFHIGYLCFAEFSWHSFLISIYFSLLFSAGHLHHMVLDFEADHAAGTQTFANLFGFKTTMNASAIVVFLSALYYAVLGCLNVVTFVSVVSIVIASCIHLALFFRFRPQMSDPIVRIRYRDMYRTVHALSFAIIGLFSLVDGTL